MSSLLRSTGIITLSTLVSRVLGLCRDMLMAAVFAASGATDAFYVAFQLPNIMRRLVAEGGLTISFIPVYTEYRIHDGDKEALLLAQKTLSILIVVVLGLVLLGEVFSAQIVTLFAGGTKDPAVLELATGLNRVMFPYLLFVSFVAFAMGVLNSHKYFFSPAFAPVLLNIGIISGVLVLSNYFKIPIYGVAVGVIIGGILQVILQFPYLARAGFKMKFSLDFRHPGIRKIFLLLGPALFGIGVYQINILVNTRLASMLEKGSISYIFYSTRLTELVLGLFVVAIGNAIIPEMSKLSAIKDLDKLKGVYVSAVRAGLFLAVPAAVALFVIGYPIISVIYMRMNFSTVDADMTYLALKYASLGIASVAVLRITTPTFYSLKDTKTPVIAATIALITNAVCGYVLMHTSLKHGGLTLANAISATLQMSILLILLRKRIGALNTKGLLPVVVKILVSAALMGGVIFYLSRLIDWNISRLSIKLLFLTLSIGAGGLVYFLSTYILKVEEIHFFLGKVIGKLRR